MAGYIKIYRDVLDTVLFTKPDLLQMWLLLSKLARFVKTQQDGIEILPGQVLTSIAELAQYCNLPERRVRYILDCLEKMELIRRQKIRKSYSLITLTNPDELQNVKQTTLPDPTEELEEPPAQPKKEPKRCYGMCMNVFLTDEEKKLLQKRTSAADSYIERLSAYKRRTEKTYNDDFAVLLEWITKDEISNPQKQQPAAPKPVKESAPTSPLSHYRDMNTDFFTAPASYDLEKAEALARSTVPKLRKRNQPKP